MKGFRKLIRIITKADIILILLLLISALILSLSFHNRSSSEFARIYHHNRLIHTVDLSVDSIFALNNSALIEVKSGKVRISESSCSQQYCVKQGWSNSNPIICVPNEILINFEDKDKSKLIITQ